MSKLSEATGVVLHDRLWIDHDPAHCTGKGCTCRGFHEPGSPALHRALHENGRLG